MILKECHDWLTAAAQALPRARSSKLRALVAENGRKAGGGLWEIGVISGATCAEGAFALRHRADDGTLLASWDASLRRDAAAPAPRKAVSAVAFDPAALGEAGTFLQEFSALCPVENMLVEKDSTRWGLRLAQPVPWPAFARLNVADPYAADGTRLAYLLGSLRVAEIWFDGGALCAYLTA